MFKSIAKLNLGKKVCASLLTGMGADGAAGLLKLKESDAYTLAQDEASSVVWGMPRAAVELDAAQKVLSLDSVANEIANWAKK